jgi:SHS2 domain-containing protein
LPEGEVEQIGRFRFEQIEHTADKAIIAHGDTFEEMLESAAAGMFAQQVDLAAVPKKRKWNISAQAESAEDLLVAWLRELIFLSERESAALCDFKIIEFSQWRVEAEVWGSEYTAEMNRTGAGVKAITYHNLYVRHEGGWQGRVTFDV